ANIQEAEEAIRRNKEPKVADTPKIAPTQYPIERVEEKPKEPEQPKKTKKTKKASVDTKGVPVSWTLQVASFEDDQRAQAFVAKLKSKGYKAYSKQVSTSVGSRVRVYAGPSMDKAKLSKMKQALDRDFKLKSLMLRFTPDS
ncbi:MAG: SPOR domain-containing protein, partial [Pseudomonadota bacterium]